MSEAERTAQASSSGANFWTNPEFYDRYLVPLNMQQHADLLVARVAGATSGNILELAAGTGVLTRALCSILPEAVHITATDLNQPMLDRAMSHPMVALRVRWQQADALALPFDDQSFNTILCQFGVMFFPDKIKAFSEARRVLKPGGQYIFSVWDRMELNVVNLIAHTTVQSLFPDNPPQAMLAPFSYYDIDLIHSDLTEAGLHLVNIERIPNISRVASPLEAALAMVQGGAMRAEIEAMGSGQIERAIDAVAAAFADRSGTGEVGFPNQAIVISAQRPAD